VAQAAKMCGRSTDTLYRAIRNGHLKAYRPWTHTKDVAPGAMIVMVDDLEGWLKANPVGTDEEASG
jgi:hypothetical protein